MLPIYNRKLEIDYDCRWRVLKSYQLTCLDVALYIAGVEKVSSENLQLQSTMEVISIRVLKQRSVSDGGNLCTLWLKIFKSLLCSVGDTL